MRHFSIVILLITILFISNNTAYSALKGGIDYSIPIDYSKISISEVEENAKKYYHNAMQIPDNTIDNNLTKALMTYSILQKLNPDNIDYYIKPGILYAKIGKDRRAKGCFFQAVSIDKKNPKPYFYLGEFYYKKQSYKHALQYYMRSYNNGYNSNYDTLYKIGDIYQKFGDTASALKYFKMAQEQNPNETLAEKIKQIDYLHNFNKIYYNN